MHARSRSFLLHLTQHFVLPTLDLWVVWDEFSIQHSILVFSIHGSLLNPSPLGLFKTDAQYIIQEHIEIKQLQLSYVCNASRQRSRKFSPVNYSPPSFSDMLIIGSKTGISHSSGWRPNLGSNSSCFGVIKISH